VEVLFKKALARVGKALPVAVCQVGTLMKELDKSFSMRGTRFKRLTNLAEHLEQTGLVRLGRDPKGTLLVLKVDSLPAKPEKDSVRQKDKVRQPARVAKTPLPATGPELPDDLAPPPTVAVTATMTAAARAIGSPPVVGAQMTIWPMEGPDVG
jgi:hypothetical protein